MLIIFRRKNPFFSNFPKNIESIFPLTKNNFVPKLFGCVKLEKKVKFSPKKIQHTKKHTLPTLNIFPSFLKRFQNPLINLNINYSTYKTKPLIKLEPIG